MITATIEAGACGFTATVTAEKTDRRTVAITIQSDCKELQALAGSITSLHLRDILKYPVTENPVYAAAAGARLHAGCPVPCAIIKSAEIALELALPKAVSLSFSKDA